MSTVEEIEAAIGRLPSGEFWKLTDRLVAMREAAWDQQMDNDAQTGKLDAIWKTAELEIAAGETEPLDAFLGNQKL